MRSKTPPRAKAHERPRYRYVLFKIQKPPGPQRQQFLERLRRAVSVHDRFQSDEPWLTRYDQRVGILRCLRGHEKSLRVVIDERLAKQGIPAESISTSGTIAALERRHRGVPRSRPRGDRR